MTRQQGWWTRCNSGRASWQAGTTFVRNGNNLEVSILNTTDRLVVQNWYLGSQYQVEQFRYADGSTVTNSRGRRPRQCGGIVFGTCRRDHRAGDAQYAVEVQRSACGSGVVRTGR